MSQMEKRTTQVKPTKTLEFKNRNNNNSNNNNIPAFMFQTNTCHLFLDARDAIFFLLFFLLHVVFAVVSHTYNLLSQYSVWGFFVCCNAFHFFVS